jgi:hypothetical protein
VSEFGPKAGQTVAAARRRGAKRLTILADPNAEGFYERATAQYDWRSTPDAVSRPPATALRSQARSHDIAVTSDIAGAQIPRSSGPRSRFGRWRASVSGSER